MSASLWGCELKWSWRFKWRSVQRQPPCEAVSWNINRTRAESTSLRQPPCEAVSWNTAICAHCAVQVRQPPCEAVSWNASGSCSHPDRLLSASLWGCELKYFPFFWFYFFSIVSLLVRLWVEIYHALAHVALSWCQPPCAAVSWNSNLNVQTEINNSQPPCEAVSWNVNGVVSSAQFRSSASLWGCELKYISECRWDRINRQPPCEAVSWNRYETRV